MKTQLLGWFFCALFCSSMAHDWIRGRASIQESKVNQLNRLDSNLLDSITNIQKKLALEGSGLLSQDLQPKTVGNSVKYYCSPNNQGIIVIVNVELSLALVCDTTNGIFCVCNGNNATAVIYIISSGLCYYTNQAWNVSSITLQLWVSTLNFTVLINQNATVVVNVSNPGAAVLGLCQEVLGCLDVELYIKVQANINICLTLAISLCIEIITCLKVNLGGLIKLHTINYVVIKGGLCGFRDICRGLNDLCVSANLCISTLIAAGISLDIQAILEADDGLTCFSYIAGIIGAQFNLVTCFNVVITNITILLRICVQLGGNVYIGVNGVLRVVAGVCGLTSSTINIDILLIIILRVCANVSGIITISAAVNSIKAVLTAQVILWNNNSGLIDINFFINSLISGTCLISNINVSLIISTLCAGVTSTILTLCIDIVAYVTAYVTVTITVSLYYATFLRVILFCLNDISGRILINIIIPGLGIPIVYSNICLNLLSGLLINILGVLLKLNLFGLVSAILSVTSLANIYNSCKNAIQAKAGLNLNTIITSSSALQEHNAIYNWMGGINNCGC